MAGEQGRRLYAVVEGNKMTHDDPFKTVKEAKEHAVEDANASDTDLGDVEIWEMRPILKPRNIETVWDDIL